MPEDTRLQRGQDLPGNTVTAAISLDETDGDWMRCFAEAAEAAGVAARLEHEPGRITLRVSFPITSSRGQVTAALDAAVQAVAVAKELARSRREQADEIEGWIKAWEAQRNS